MRPLPHSWIFTPLLFLFGKRLMLKRTLETTNAVPGLDGNEANQDFALYVYNAVSTS
jgi:hypothetical protein